MTTDLALRLGNTFIGAMRPAAPAERAVATLKSPGFWQRFRLTVANAFATVPGRFTRRAG